MNAHHYGKPVTSRWDDALTRVDAYAFERIVRDYYTAQGYRVEHSGTGGGAHRTDGGIDLKLYRDDEYVVVQCKHWVALQVDHTHMHQLIGVMHTQPATRALIITSGEFTAAAKRAAKEFPAIQLIEGHELRGMLGPIPEPAPALPVASQATAGTAVSSHPEPSWMHDGVRPRSRRRYGRRRRTWQSRVAEFAVAVVVMYGAYLYAMHIMNNLGRDLTETTTAHTRKATNPPYTPPQYNTAANRYSATPQPVVPPSYGNPQLASITRPDGTPVTPTRPPVKQEDIEAWKRQNAESMRILEQTTPVLQVP